MKKSLRSFDDVETALRPYIPLVKVLTGKDTVLDRILPFMDFLGNPQNKLKTIHLAGTSGKTSTAYYTASLLREAGQKFGLTVSPHIDHINERTQINGRPLEEAVFASEMSDFLELVRNSGQANLSYFEVIYAFSIWLFARHKVDYAVIETGVGGLYDATNVVSREDKICVLTDIGFDHMSLLGNTLEEIAAQKVGIVHAHNQLLMYDQDPAVMSVVKSWVKSHDALLLTTTETAEAKDYGQGPAFKTMPAFQKRNWLLAYFVYRFAAERDNLTKLGDKSLAKTQSLTVPARMDVSNLGSKTLIMDGAHNYQKMLAFISSYKKLFPGSRPAFLIGFKSDKDYEKVIPLIKDLASEIIVSSFKKSEDLPVTSIEPEVVAAALYDIGAANVSVVKDCHEAYLKLLKSKSKELVITGSFYLISQIREGL